MSRDNPTIETPSIDFLSHPFFNWRWSVVDVVLLLVLAYTLA